MYFNLWGFLAITTPFIMLMVIVAIYYGHKKEMKVLELESLKVKKANLKDEVNDAVARDLAGIMERVEVLEAIVTDKKYQLKEKISELE